MKRYHTTQSLRRVMWLGIATSLLMLALLYLSTPIAHADLPDRPPTPVPTANAAANSKPVGGWVQVRASNVTNQLVGVQWQDAQAAWHDVESWRGQFDTIQNGVGIKTWWIDKDLFGLTNFRWVVYDASRAPRLSGSTFQMPRENKQTVTVDLNAQ